MSKQDNHLLFFLLFVFCFTDQIIRPDSNYRNRRRKMYKSKLQELCHQKMWGLPTYSSVKDGPDHNPEFRASVSVNGETYNTSTSFKSSKEASNEVAKLAFVHITSDDDPINGGNKIEEIRVPEENPSNTSIIIPNSQYKYKMMLQNYAQRKNMELPKYANRKVGPPHDLQFTAIVTVGGESFESPNFCKSLKEAEHAAAQAALLSLSLDSSQENDSMFCKNLLQELTQNEGLMLPAYKTVKCGEANSPTFISTVEIERENFQGKAAKSKKQAEFNAAQKAYNALMERKSNRSTGDFTSSISSRIEPLKLTDDSTESGCHRLVTNSAIKYEEQAKENIEDVNVDSYLFCNRVRVYNRKPDQDFPKGTVLLPFSDDKWVAVSLEFPNEI